MGWQGADWLERGEREDEEAPEVALNVLKIPKGAAVADIGAGSGFVTVKLSARVGPEGRVFANDIQPQMLQMLQQRLTRQKITNVTLVQGTVDDPKLQAKAAELGATVLTGSPADFSKLVADETEKWAKVIKFAGIKSE